MHQKHTDSLAMHSSPVVRLSCAASCAKHHDLAAKQDLAVNHTRTQDSMTFNKRQIAIRKVLHALTL